MKIPVIRGVIDRRILLNYHVEPDVLARLLPAPFRPRIVHGVGMAGLCLIRLRRIRPAFAPGWLGIASENAALRIAVEWSEGGVARDGVFIRRRETSSWLNALAGGRVFPGVHHHARFHVEESGDEYVVAARSDDGVTSLTVRGRRSDRLSPSSVFSSLGEASSFFEQGVVGYSTTSRASRFQGLELRCLNWSVESLEIEEARSSFFDDESRFPRGSIGLDCALLMRGIEHEWHSRDELCCPEQRRSTGHRAHAVEPAANS